MSRQIPKLGRSVLDDDRLIEKAKNAANGRQFTSLYEDGWNSRVVRRVYDQRRHAELALVVHLVWWSRHEADQVRRLFKQSALYRDDIDNFSTHFNNLLQSARELLGDECYDPEYDSD